MELWLAQWQGVMRSRDMLRPADDGKLKWEKARDTHVGRLKWESIDPTENPGFSINLMRCLKP